MVSGIYYRFIGPLLFNITNDIKLSISEAMFLLFADNIKIYKSIKYNTECMDLQICLDNISKWCMGNDMRLNITKCKTYTFMGLRNVDLYSHNIDGSSEDKVNVIKDLGIVFDSKLTLETQINASIRKTSQILGFVKRKCNYFIHL